MTRGKLIGALLLVATAAFGLTMSMMTAHPTAQASRSAAAPVAERVNLVIVPDALRGPDKKTHDAYIPAYLTAKAGQEVIVTVYNLDNAPHSFTAPKLGLNVMVPGAKTPGLEGTTSFFFTAKKPGAYTWRCILPCDNGGVNAWAMIHDGYMAGTITITPS